MGMHPVFHRTADLGVRKPMFRIHVTVTRYPAYGQDDEPEGEIGDRSLGQRFDMMDPHPNRWRSQPLQRVRIAVQIGHRQERSAHRKGEIEGSHLSHHRGSYHVLEDRLQSLLGLLRR